MPLGSQKENSIKITKIEEKWIQDMGRSQIAGQRIKEREEERRCKERENAAKMEWLHRKQKPGDMFKGQHDGQLSKLLLYLPIFSPVAHPTSYYAWGFPSLESLWFIFPYEIPFVFSGERREYKLFIQSFNQSLFSAACHIFTFHST